MIIRSKKYLSFIRSRPCCVSGIEGDMIIPHHVRCLGDGGMGIKPSDLYTVPLSTTEHQKLHQVGEKAYWEANYLNPAWVMSLNMMLYLTEKSYEKPNIDPYLYRTIAEVIIGLKIV